ncbi:NAD-dependent epimerase/dehydratase family protein [Desulfofustis glycolicus]|uniref:Nucleoside-diphosphate-sugar epimerase n=1 Tax=Desulfofustis glycolicus DSM 9705 TaxID=1121409 RepID=A0A1M5Y139_9BACT|nr:NAD-dependent epimerase/dehydratase family protein [Desulfofustis glycolicus]MCB2217715.1 NAD-dependent epimerase/dehydratase family protein [Desulfobulbaceae bacterium]SHI05780.1 Nucleoside-diphosphate-sugar epimerase [Desulfofustis glycolicus DSM 9705]
MKILVTGGTGFTGKALVRRLLKDGHHVIALDFQEGLKTQELRDWGAEVVIGTVTDKAVVDRCMTGVDIVHHLAAAFRQLNVPNSYYWDVNVEGTKNVLAAAFREKVKKFVYCSTCGVHGNVEHPPGDENAPINAADYYQQTKYEAEPIVRQYQEKGMATTILRPAAIYGPGDPERFFMIFKRVNKGLFPMFGNGKTLYHPLYIDHLIDAHVLAQEPGRGDGEAYLIADEQYVEIETLVKKTADALGVSVKIPHLPIWPVIIVGHICEKVCTPLKITPPIFPRRVDWYRQNRAFSIDKAKRDLGYHPQISLDEGLRRTAAWYKQEGYL